MKEPKKIRKAVNALQKLIEYLHYYMGDTPEFRKLVKEELSILENTLVELSVDEKIKNRRLATKLKEIWKKENEQ